MQSDDVGHQLINRGYNAEVIHGDLAQKQRELILHKLRERRITIVVATDVAARGIDVQDLTHVVNYSIPQNPDTYIHRIGRTGRAGKMGIAITFVTPSEMRRFTYIKRMVKSDIKQETIPDVRAIVEAKRKRLVLELEHLLEKKQWSEDFEMIANYLLRSNEPENVVAAMLRHTYGNILDESIYRPIEVIQKEKPRSKRDRYRKEDNYSLQERFDSYTHPRYEEDRSYDGGPVRLFIAKGRATGMTKRLLVDFIIERAHVTDREVNDVEVLENFSFVTAPPAAAKRILNAFTEVSSEGKPLVTKAKPDNPSGKYLTSFRSGRRERSSGRDDSRPRERQSSYWQEQRNGSREKDDRRDRFSYPKERSAPSYAKSSKMSKSRKSSKKGR